jgi:NADPH-dependent ferric siderophore reductase
MKDEIQKVTLGTNEALRVTADGEFIWHPEADAMIEKGDFTSSPAMRHILRALRKALAAPDLQAELDATNRQVEILSDALAESRREVDAMIALARADERDKWMERAHIMILGEREACAKVCETFDQREMFNDEDMAVANACAAAIRARGNT